MTEETIKLGDYIKKARGGRTAQSVSDASKALYPNEIERQISLSYLVRIEQGQIHDISPRKLKTLATTLNLNYHKLLYLAGYLDNYKGIKGDNDKELEEVIDVKKILTNPNVRLHFSGNPIEEEKKEALLMLLKVLIQK
jgi:transcriptional regulator with XRE-family HTH domain